MEVYLPIAEVSINIFIILFLSFIVGFLSGLFGIGGGFLMTPFLIFLGIPPTYAVANEANNILASSVSGSLTHWFKREFAKDIKEDDAFNELAKDAEKSPIGSKGIIFLPCS